MPNKTSQAGTKALKLAAKEKVRKNKENLKRALLEFRASKIPIIKTELVKVSGLSIATLNRSPYKEMIQEFMDEEKVLLSPNGRQEVAALIRENRELKQEIKEWKERYNRLKKEIRFSKELFS